MIRTFLFFAGHWYSFWLDVLRVFFFLHGFQTFSPFVGSKIVTSFLAFSSVLKLLLSVRIHVVYIPVVAFYVSSQ